PPPLIAVAEPVPNVPVAAPASSVPLTPPKLAAESDPKGNLVKMTDPVRERVLALVAEKTGYPVDMLDLDLDLEADLGVDTVKQAEVFATIREAYSIPRDENRKLRDYPTLAHVIRFVYEKRPDLAAAPAREKTEVNLATPKTAEVALKPTFAAASAQVTAGDAVKERILALVVEKTGYPKDMLDLDLDLEADLGVDTVKQAEMFAAIREIYSIPRDENLKLRDFPTLAHVIKFAHDRQPGLAKASARSDSPTPEKQEPAQKKPAMSASSASNPIPTVRPIPASFEAANRIPRRVPVPNLRPPLALCKPTGVTLGSGRRVVIMPDKSGVADALTQRLRTLGVEVLRIEQTIDAEAEAGALTNRLKNWLAAGPVHGIYWLPALDNEGDLTAM